MEEMGWDGKWGINSNFSERTVFGVGKRRGSKPLEILFQGLRGEKVIEKHLLIAPYIHYIADSIIMHVCRNNCLGEQIPIQV